MRNEELVPHGVVEVEGMVEVSDEGPIGLDELGHAYSLKRKGKDGTDDRLDDPRPHKEGEHRHQYRIEGEGNEPSDDEPTALPYEIEDDPKGIGDT